MGSEMEVGFGENGGMLLAASDIPYFCRSKLSKSNLVFIPFILDQEATIILSFLNRISFSQLDSHQC